MHKLFYIGFILIQISCEEALYKFDNMNDPFNMDLEPPALFFHPSLIETSTNNQDSVEVYGLQLDSAAAAHIEVIYEYGMITIDSILPGAFFTNINNPIEIVVEEGNKIQIFLYYLPDMESDQSIGGTRSLVKIYFSTLETAGTYGLEFGSNTKLRDAQNDSIRINTFGLGSINVQ
jgi:hypothetical protein